MVAKLKQMATVIPVELDLRGVKLLEECAQRGVTEYHPGNILDLCALAREAWASREELALLRKLSQGGKP